MTLCRSSMGIDRLTESSVLRTSSSQNQSRPVSLFDHVQPSSKRRERLVKLPMNTVVPFIIKPEDVKNNYYSIKAPDATGQILRPRRFLMQKEPLQANPSRKHRWSLCSVVIITHQVNQTHQELG